MSETMHHSAVLTSGINTTSSKSAWDVVGSFVILHVFFFFFLFFFLRPDAVQPAAPDPHYRVVHFDVSGVDLTNSTLVKAEFRIFRAPNPLARASEQRVEIYQVKDDSKITATAAEPPNEHVTTDVSNPFNPPDYDQVTSSPPFVSIVL